MIMSSLHWQRFFRKNNRLFGRRLPNGPLPVPVVVSVSSLTPCLPLFFLRARLSLFPYSHTFLIFLLSSLMPFIMLQNMLRQLYLKGPFTVGIFRKSANARICREVEAQLEEDHEFCLDEVPITVVGSVFKDFLRSLPNCLLDSRLLNKWIEAVNADTPAEQRASVKKLLDKLPAENLLLLQHVVCLLWHIAQHSSVNKMCPSNLAVCIGPSLLSSSKIISPVRREVSRISFLHLNFSFPYLLTRLLLLSLPTSRLNDGRMRWERREEAEAAIA
jgi:hypothetical protein